MGREDLRWVSFSHNMIIVMQKRKITKRLIAWAGVVALVLMVPLVAMQFTNEVVWTSSDFVIAGVLLFGSGLAYVLATANVTSFKRRTFIGIAVAAVLLLIWADLAVGIFNIPGISGS